MITITKSLQSILEGRTEFTCPKCKIVDVFFKWVPKNCLNCNCVLPDLDLFDNQGNEVMKWHFKKDVV